MKEIKLTINHLEKRLHLCKMPVAVVEAETDEDDDDRAVADADVAFAADAFAAVVLFLILLQLFAFNGRLVGVEVGILIYTSELEVASLKGILINCLKPVFHRIRK